MFDVGLLQIILHDYLVRKVSSNRFNYYTFCYIKLFVLYMYCVINSNSGMHDMWGIDSVSFGFSFLLNHNNITCMHGMVMYLSIDGSTSYFAQPYTDGCLQQCDMTLSSNVIPALVMLV